MKTADLLITVDAIPDAWFHTRREVIIREKRLVKPADGNRIRVKSTIENRWFMLQLPNNAVAFASKDDRDLAIVRLTQTVTA